MPTDEGGPAFPGGVNSAYTNIDDGEPTQPGMTLRDWFAGMALSNSFIMEQQFINGDGVQEQFGPNVHPEHLANQAYEVADAMLAERSEES